MISHKGKLLYHDMISYIYHDIIYSDKIVLKMKDKIEYLALNTNWDDAAIELIKRKDEWSTLPFFEQSNWKCKFYNNL